MRIYCICGFLHLLVIVLLLLFPPVLVQLVDFHSSVSLFNQVKSLEKGSLIIALNIVSFIYIPKMFFFFFLPCKLH